MVKKGKKNISGTIDLNSKSNIKKDRLVMINDGLMFLFLICKPPYDITHSFWEHAHDKSRLVFYK